MKTYNGHRSWNAWNVNLWLTNDQDYYYGWCWMPKNYSLERAIRQLMKSLPSRTPDGAVFNRLSIKLAIEENWENAK
tara:strand:- start:13258 stop:13488 length:231 start_codon:yes stop_codon:yes gene_type:complete